MHGEQQGQRLHTLLCPHPSGIKLFPPQEATYPTYVDFDAATRWVGEFLVCVPVRFSKRRLHDL